MNPTLRVLIEEWPKRRRRERGANYVTDGRIVTQIIPVGAKPLRVLDEELAKQQKIAMWDCGTFDSRDRGPDSIYRDAVEFAREIRNLPKAYYLFKIGVACGNGENPHCPRWVRDFIEIRKRVLQYTRYLESTETITLGTYEPSNDSED